jgi:transaldolase
MKIFIDSADLDEIKMACSWGIIDGATTNPSLIKRAVDRRGGQITMEAYITEILQTVPGSVSLEVIALTAREMVDQAKTLYTRFSHHGDVAIKIPITPCMEDGRNRFDGLQAIKQLSEANIPTNATLIMTPEQALLAAKAGATYVSPFAGRIDDYIRRKLGQQRGVDFQKQDYLDTDMVERILTGELMKRLGGMASPSRRHQLQAMSDVLEAGHDRGVDSGVDLVRRILTIFRNYGYRAEVIAASIRNARQVREVAELGVHIATLPLTVLTEMIQHEKTVEGIKSFTADIVPVYAKLFT